MNKKEKMNLFAILLTIQTMTIGIFTLLIILIFITISTNNTINKSITLFAFLIIPLIIGLILSLKSDKKTLNKLENIITENERNFTLCPFDSETNKKA